MDLIPLAHLVTVEGLACPVGGLWELCRCICQELVGDWWAKKVFLLSYRWILNCSHSGSAVSPILCKGISTQYPIGHSGTHTLPSPTTSFILLYCVKVFSQRMIIKTGPRKDSDGYLNQWKYYVNKPEGCLGREICFLDLCLISGMVELCAVDEMSQCPFRGTLLFAFPSLLPTFSCSLPVISFWMFNFSSDFNSLISDLLSAFQSSRNPPHSCSQTPKLGHLSFS